MQHLKRWWAFLIRFLFSICCRQCGVCGTYNGNSAFYGTSALSWMCDDDGCLFMNAAGHGL